MIDGDTSASPRGRGAHRLDEQRGAGVLEQEAARPVGDARCDVLVEVERGDDDDRDRVGRRRGRPGGGWPPARPARACGCRAGTRRGAAAGQLDRLAPVGGLADHLDAVGLEDQPEARAHHLLVVGDDDAQPERSRLGASTARRCTGTAQPATRHPPVAIGPASNSSAHRRSTFGHADAVRTTSRASGSLGRRRWSRANGRHRRRSVTSMSMFVAPTECRRALVTASRAMRWIDAITVAGDGLAFESIDGQAHR